VTGAENMKNTCAKNQLGILADLILISISIFSEILWLVLTCFNHLFHFQLHVG